MAQRQTSRLPEKLNRRVAQKARSSSSARAFQGKLPSPILQLQRTLGNRRVAQLIRARRLTPQGKIIGLQRKLVVGAADDQYEQEADRVARQVMSIPGGVVAWRRIRCNQRFRRKKTRIKQHKQSPCLCQLRHLCGDKRRTSTNRKIKMQRSRRSEPKEALGCSGSPKWRKRKLNQSRPNPPHH